MSYFDPLLNFKHTEAILQLHTYPEKIKLVLKRYVHSHIWGSASFHSHTKHPSMHGRIKKMSCHLQPHRCVKKTLC